jgi:Fe-S cluster assembly protein SufD
MNEGLMPDLLDRPSVLGGNPVASYLADFDARRARLAAEPSWLRQQRETAIEAFGRLGFPTTTQEEWRNTNVAPIGAAPIPRAAAQATPATVAMIAGFSSLQPAAELVFVNGEFAPSLSSRGDLPPGVRVENLALMLAAPVAGPDCALGEQANVDGHAFAALNAALFADAAIVRVPPGCRIENPIHLVFLAESPGARVAMYPRVLVVAGEGSEVRVIERYAGRDSQQYFTNAVSEIVVGDGALVDHYRVQCESSRAFHVGMLHVRCGRDSRFSSHSIALGGALVRNEVSAVLGDVGGSCELNGLYLADGNTLVDNHTAIDHTMPHCESHELYKGVLGGHARGVFHGKIIVRPDAQKTDAKQTNKALLLSDHAQVNSKPQLEIFANDVRCTHGAAVGQLDDEALFYLKARGVGADDARRMLVEAFVGDVLGRVRLASLGAELDALLQSRLQAMLEPAATSIQS